MREQTAREYLKTIFVLEREGVVRGAYIAREMDLTKATVSVALKALVEDGCLVMDADHSVRLTEKGRQLARESIHQTVRTGRSYHELVQQLQEQESDPEAGERLLQERALRRLEKERTAGLLEAHSILSGRYYCVRAVDLAHYLDLSSAAVRTRLRRLEQSGYLHLGEDTVVTLTPSGKTLAAQLYEAHRELRDSLQAEGLTEDEAARQAARSHT